MLEIKETRTPKPKPHKDNPMTQQPLPPIEDNQNPDGTVKPQTGQVTPDPKPWYQSKTLLFNMAVAGLGMASSVTPYLKPVVKPKTFSKITTGIAFANMALRLMTSKPVSYKSGNLHD